MQIFYVCSVILHFCSYILKGLEIGFWHLEYSQWDCFVTSVPRNDKEKGARNDKQKGPVSATPAGGTPDNLRNSSAAQKTIDNFLGISSSSFCQGNSLSTHEENHQSHYYHRPYNPDN